MNNNMSVNLRIEILKQNILALIGDADLPVGIVYYILKDLFDDITNAYNQSITLEQTSLENSLKENKGNEDEDKENKIKEHEN